MRANVLVFVKCIKTYETWAFRSRIDEFGVRVIDFIIPTMKNKVIIEVNPEKEEKKFSIITESFEKFTQEKIQTKQQYIYRFAEDEEDFNLLEELKRFWKTIKRYLTD